MDDTAVDACFSATYADARARFIGAAEAAGLDVRSQVHPLRGREGETLALDVAREGPAEAAALLVVSSACHGAEGFCGSGVQVALLRDATFRAEAAAAGVAVLYLHALNPWGFSWLRRTTHENVDLNRNFHDFSRPLPANPGYDELAGAIVPDTWPPPPEADARLAGYAQVHGAFALQTAISAGQYSHPQGLFYGGVNPTWSHQALRHVLADEARRCSRLAFIDLHTGLGPEGHGEKIFAGRGDPAALARAKAWWGPEVTSTDDGSSTSAPLEGLLWNGYLTACPQAELTGLALEYGTVPFDQVMAALRADQWLENHPETDDTRRAAIKRQMRDAFYVDTTAWKRAILTQGADAARRAVRGLSAQP